MVGNVITISPLTGARTSLSVNSIANPSPIALVAKTWSSTSSILISFPVIGDTNFSLSIISVSIPKSLSVNFFLPTIYVKTNGITIAIIIAIAKFPIYFGIIDKIPGIPPTPTEVAIVPVATENVAAIAEPIIPHTKGNIYFKLTPNKAGSVTPK